MLRANIRDHCEWIISGFSLYIGLDLRRNLVSFFVFLSMKSLSLTSFLFLLCCFHKPQVDESQDGTTGLRNLYLILCSKLQPQLKNHCHVRCCINFYFCLHHTTSMSQRDKERKRQTGTNTGSLPQLSDSWLAVFTSVIIISLKEKPERCQLARPFTQIIVL